MAWADPFSNRHGGDLKAPEYTGDRPLPTRRQPPETAAVTPQFVYTVRRDSPAAR
jgi:hypothetical protein